MTERNTLTLHSVNAHSRRIEYNVNNMVVQQVYLVNVKNIAVCIGKYSRFEVLFACFQRSFNVKSSNHSVLCGADRQIDHPHMPFDCFKLAFAAAAVALAAPVIRVAGKGTALRFHALGENLSQRTYSSGFCRAFFALYQNSSQCGIYQIKYQGTLHFFLSHYCRKWEIGSFIHWSSPSILFSVSR